ncbi:amidohydrolase [Alkalihalophilus pseudofirmus]|uniref:amidohydrolase n=1 Tax=Alkalihalobacterium alkalinitrilicum TaxID=427920 RepID=UPI00094D9423|nr:amidohydrolase [Alkalihalobacterium alkalinitrilicum]OLO26458.1 amidohydrolase [Alkalihalophilus pseudofirmus]
MKAIINAHILGETEITKGTILFEDGKIINIGNEADIEIPATAQVIDANGKYVTAGFIDAHTHLGIDEEGVRWEGQDYNETTSAVTPHLRALDGIYPYDGGFNDAVAAGVTTAQVLPGSANVIGGLTVCIKIRLGKSVDEMILREPSGLKIALGENPKSAHGNNGRAPKTRMAVAAILREQFSKAKHYMEKKKKGENVFDFELEALQLALERKIPVRAHAHRADDIMTVIRIAKEFDLDLSVEHTTEGHQIAHLLAESGAKFTVGPTISSRSKVELRDKGWQTYKALEEANVPFAITTDHPVIPIQYLQTSVNLAVKEGLSEQTALNSVTKYAADVLGIQDQTGTLEIGKDADIVIWDAHPLRQNSYAWVTFVDGEIVYQKEEK